MGVAGGEVELAGNEEQHGAHCGKTGVAAGFAFGRLEEAIEGLDEAVGLTSLGPGDDAVEVSADHAGDVLHRRDPRFREGRLLERRTLVHHCLSMVATTLICLRSRMARKPSR